ncbi:hypothetical protein [Neolewinella persica]|uniref:hypothetical protein n=1 Tax=Neolewinella persica TaxID=70998 RepID=UPI00036B0CBB|nr:hypothetical protein [Neolewinella persica]
MSSIISKRLSRAINESTTSSPAFVLPAELREQIAALAQKAVLPAVVTGLMSLLAFSAFNDKLFFNELLVSSFIILMLVFFKTITLPKK